MRHDTTRIRRRLLPVSLPRLIRRWRYILPRKPKRTHKNQWIHPRFLHDNSMRCDQRRRSKIRRPICINGSIHVFSTIIPCVVASAGEAKYTALFAAGQHAASLRTTLADMGYTQEPTIIMCDNTSAIGIATDSIKQKRSKAVDMRFHWIRDRVRQNQFIVAYIPTQQNLADYFTKTLPKESHNKLHSHLVHNMASDSNIIVRS